MPEYKFSIIVKESSQQDVFIVADTEEEARFRVTAGEFDWDNDVKFGEYLNSEHWLKKLISIDKVPV